ncbi:hypothetical protein FRC18_010191 [Serendipita sp. 400]|nr:hypothetical protein FRC18_010191 [Serendipita sp. 400]
MGGDHKCPVCGSTFTRSQHVARHMRSRCVPFISKFYPIFPISFSSTGTGSRPYKCVHCGDQFVRSGLLSRHVKKCHKNEKKAGPMNGSGRRKGRQLSDQSTTMTTTGMINNPQVDSTGVDPFASSNISVPAGWHPQYRIQQMTRTLTHQSATTMYSHPQYQPLSGPSTSHAGYSFQSPSTSMLTSSILPSTQGNGISPPESHCSSQCSSPGNAPRSLPLYGQEMSLSAMKGRADELLDFEKLMADMKRRHFPERGPIYSHKRPNDQSRQTSLSSLSGREILLKPYACALCHERFRNQNSLNLHSQLHDLEQRILLSEQHY